MSHPKLAASIEHAFQNDETDNEGVATVEEHVTEAKAHGREERRRVRVRYHLEDIEGIEAWKGVSSIVEVERTRTVGDTRSIERAYYLSSLALDAARIGARIRAHWGIENSLHWVLDVTYGEDKSRVRDRTSAANLTALRKPSVSLLSRTPSRGAKSIAQRRKLAGWVPDYAFEVLAAISRELDAAPLGGRGRHEHLPPRYAETIRSRRLHPLHRRRWMPYGRRLGSPCRDAHSVFAALQSELNPAEGLWRYIGHSSSIKSALHALEPRLHSPLRRALGARGISTDAPSMISNGGLVAFVELRRRNDSTGRLVWACRDHQIGAVT